MPRNFCANLGAPTRHSKRKPRQLHLPLIKLVVELGAEQGPAVGEAATGAGFEIADVRPDLAGIPRVLAAVRC